MQRTLQAFLQTLAYAGPSVSDAELLRRFLAHEDHAFAELVRRHGRLVWAVCLNLTRSDADAEDAFQATFLVLLKNADKVRDAGKLSAWLHGVAHKVCANARKAARRRTKHERATAVRNGDGGFVPESAWHRALAAVHQEAAMLPEALRVPFVLCCLEGFKPTEAAGRLGWKLGTLTGRLTRAKDAVLAKLQARGLPIGVAAVSVAVPSTAAVAKASALSRVGFAVPDSVIYLTRGVIGMSVTSMKVSAAALLLTCGLGLCFGVKLTPDAAAQQPSIRIVKPKSEFETTLAKRTAITEPAKGWSTKHTFIWKSPVTAVAVGPDFIVTGHQNGDLVVWDSKTGKEKETLVDGEKSDGKRIDRIQISTDASLLYLVTADRLFANKCGVTKENLNFMGLGCGVKWCGVRPDGDRWLGIDKDQKRLVMVKDPFDRDKFDQLARSSHMHPDAIDLAAAVNDDAVVTIAGGVLRRWKAEGEEQVWEQKLDKAEPTQLSVGAAGEIIAVADKCGEVQLFSAETGRATVKLSGHAGPVLAVAFSRNGKRVATGGEDKTVRVWDVESGKELAKLEGHTNAVAAVAFSLDDDEMIVTGGADKSARVWVFTK